MCHAFYFYVVPLTHLYIDPERWKLGLSGREIRIRSLEMTHETAGASPDCATTRLFSQYRTLIPQWLGQIFRLFATRGNIYTKHYDIRSIFFRFYVDLRNKREIRATSMSCATSFVNWDVRAYLCSDTSFEDPENKGESIPQTTSTEVMDYPQHIAVRMKCSFNMKPRRTINLEDLQQWEKIRFSPRRDHCETKRKTDPRSSALWITWTRPYCRSSSCLRQSEPEGE